MAVTFLEVARGLVYDEAEKAAFARDPAGYLAARGFDGLAADDVADAIRFAVDNLPAPVARDVGGRLEVPDGDTHGLAALAATRPHLAELADPEGLDDWAPPPDTDGVDAATTADDIDIVVEGFGEGSPDVDSDLGVADPDVAADPDLAGTGAPMGTTPMGTTDPGRLGPEEAIVDHDTALTWDIDASRDSDDPDPLSAQDAGQAEPGDPEPDASVDPMAAAEPGIDDHADPEDLGL